MRDELEEAARSGRWLEVWAMVSHLPAESATMRAAGRWTHSEQIADLTLQHLTAMRAEAVTMGSKRRSTLTPTSYIAEVIKARTPTTIAGVVERLRAANLPQRRNDDEGV